MFAGTAGILLCLAIASCRASEKPTSAANGPGTSAAGSAGSSGGRPAPTDDAAGMAQLRSALARPGQPITVSLADAMVSGVASESDRLSVAVVDEAGHVRRSAEVQTLEGEPWSVSLSADDGLPDESSPQALGLILIGSLEAGYARRVPELESVIHRTERSVSGKTAADAAVSLRLASAGRQPFSEVRSGPDGAFTATWPATLTVPTVDSLFTTVRLTDGLTVVSERHLPYLRISLHPGDVKGALNPYANSTISVFDSGGRQRGTIRVNADRFGDFTAWIRDPEGNRIVPGRDDMLAVGDRSFAGSIRTREVGAPNRTVHGINVDPLHVAVDAERNALRGTGISGSRIDITMWNPWIAGAQDLTTEIGDDSGWNVPATFPLVPATHYYVTEVLPDSNQIFYCQQVPMLHVEPGSPIVHIQTLSGVTAELTLTRGGKPIAVATSDEKWSGDVEVAFSNTVSAGDEIEGTLNGDPVRVKVTQLDASYEPQTAIITGHAPPGTALLLAAPAPVTTTTVTAAADGSFTIDASSVGTADQRWDHDDRFEVFYVTDSGHHIRRQFRPLSIAVILASEPSNSVSDTATDSATPAAASGSSVSSPNSEIRIAADPHVQVTVSRRSKGGQSVKPSDVKTDERGIAVVPVVAGELPLASGDEITVQLADATVTMTMPVLSASLDAENRVIRGTAPAGEYVTIAVTVGTDGGEDLRTAVADDQGTWSFDLDKPPGGIEPLRPNAKSKVEVLLWQGRNQAMVKAPAH